MFFPDFRIAIRYVFRHRQLTVLNLLGLAVGLICAILILLWVWDEKQYNHFLEEGDQLYQVFIHETIDGETETYRNVQRPLEYVLEDEIPEIESATATQGGLSNNLFSYGEKKIKGEGKLVSPSFFETIGYDLMVGNPETALLDKSSVVISEGLAEKVFGEDWRLAMGENGVIGEQFLLDETTPVKVTGIFPDLPKKSTFQFEFVRPFQWEDQNWGNWNYRIYAKLTENAVHEQVDAKVANLIMTHDDEQEDPAILFLHPFQDLYLYSEFKEGKLVGGRIEYVRIFSALAFFILLIACINYINLVTAQSPRRSKEIGVKKVLGASQNSLLSQFFGETLVLTLVAMLIALVSVWILLPWFNQLTEKQVSIPYGDGAFWAILLGIYLGTSFLAGIYPSLQLSAFKLSNMLKGISKYKSAGVFFRKGLVVFQFSLSILLIIFSLAVHYQIDYIRKKNLGYDRENLMYVFLEDNLKAKLPSIKEDLRKRPGVQAVSAANNNLLWVGQETSDPTWPGKSPESNTPFTIINAEHDFVTTMGIPLLEGRAFSTEFATDTANYILNNKAVEAMGLENPINSPLEFGGIEGKVIGVIEDFHLESLFININPIIIRCRPEYAYILLVKTEPGQTSEAISSIEATFDQFSPGFPVDYQFLDASYNEVYKAETMVGKVSYYFALLAIFVACLGLVGLASFISEVRTKEIGIRKVFGASVGRLFLWLSKDFLILVLLALLVAIPFGIHFINGWLGKFVYHIELSIGVFILAGAIALLVAWLAVTYHLLQLSRSNPIKSLRIER